MHTICRSPSRRELFRTQKIHFGEILQMYFAISLSLFIEQLSLFHTAFRSTSTYLLNRYAIVLESNETDFLRNPGPTNVLKINILTYLLTYLLNLNPKSLTLTEKQMSPFVECIS